MNTRSLNRINQKVVALFSVILVLAPSAWSWGRLGQRVAARFAEDRLTPAARAAVQDILGPGVRLADISTWSDEQQEVPRSWHYVNIPLTESRYDPKYCQSGGCLVSKIEDFRRVLQNPKAGKSEKERALKFLVSLIADLHQPLNVGEAGGRNGNSLPVRFFGTESTLRRVWDSQIMERHTTNEQVWLWDMTHYANPAKVTQWFRGTPEDWATETLRIAKKAHRLPGSETAIKPGTNINAAYCAFALPIIQEQLAKAGVRIAFVLNTLFKQKPLQRRG